MWSNVKIQNSKCPPFGFSTSRHPDLGELLLLLDALLRTDRHLSVLRPDGLGPRQDVFPDDQDIRQRLLHGVLEEGSRLEQGVLQDHLDLIPAEEKKGNNLNNEHILKL